MLLAVRTLAPTRLQHVNGIIIFTDNISASFSLASGKTRNQILGACARELWLEAALLDVELHIKHKPGHQIPLADALSRASVNPAMRQLADTEVLNRKLLRLAPALHGYKFSMTLCNFSVTNIFTDDGSQLFTQMAASYASSVAPGTVANRRRQAEEYLTFALQYRVPYLSASVTHVCMYAQRLANLHAALSLQGHGTHTAVEKGVPLEEIKLRGTWRSNSGVRPYLEPYTPVQ